MLIAFDAMTSSYPAVEHDRLVQEVKRQQRSSDVAREAWRHFCGQRTAGVRDPAKLDGQVLCDFLAALAQGLPRAEATEATPRKVRSACPCLKGEQLELWMPESEASVMRDVVNANCYGLAPGKSSLLIPGDVVLDVGSHVGVAAALALRSQVTVVCLEPHPVTFQLLTRNLGHEPRATLRQLAVADSSSSRQLFPHRGTNNPSRLFFASLFDARSHAEAISVDCISLQDLISSHMPTVVKIDAEGAERYLSSVDDFVGIRRLVVEWDWTHNRQESSWNEVRAHLESHGFKLKILGHMPDFQDGLAKLTDSRQKKRGKTGMIFMASRKPSSLALKPAPCVPLEEPRPEAASYLYEPGGQPPLEAQLQALTLEQMEERLRSFGRSVREVAAQELFDLGFKERRRAELVGGLVALPRTARRLRGLPVASKPLLPLLQRLPWDGNQRPAVRAEGYLTLKASQVDAQPESLRELWQAAGRALLEAVPWAEWSAVAVTKDFRGSPHVDQNDLGVQFAMSLGDFQGGELCIEESAESVVHIDTRDRVACIDGRYPHWVSGYSGERYSMIFYRSLGLLEVPVRAVHLTLEAEKDDPRP